MINIIITSFGEPNSTLRCIKSFLDQNIEGEFKIIVVDPFEKTKEFLKENLRDKRVGFFLDSGEGKSYALNILFEKLYSKNKKDIFILTDGDVYVNSISVKEIVEAFKDEKVGCVTGRPVLLNPREKFMGYISHVAFDGIHRTRKRMSKNEEFFECSGYLFAIRNGVLQGFPNDASEDSIIPYLFWKEGYKIKYVAEAEVYVMNPQNWNDFKLQKIRNIKGHENLNKIAPDMPRTKSFYNEVKEGSLFALLYPENIKELIYTPGLFLTRFYIYIKAYYDLKYGKGEYTDGWRVDEIESTRSLD